MAFKLTLPAFSAADDVDLVVPTSLSLMNARVIEPIGYAYHRAAAVAHDIESGYYFGTKKIEVAKKVEAETTTFGRDSAASAKFMKLSADELAIDWYDVLKLEQGQDATENDIRNAYRRRCLDTHPDKQPDHSDALFKQVQRAFEILGCPNGRRAFDSSLPFDDTIPNEDMKMDEETFYATFGPVFERNRKWSVDPRIPLIGDANTPLPEVNRFYDAWYRFNSWRDFSHEADIQEVREDMARDEKRYYQKENQRILDKHKRTEQKRIRTLVERAQKMDPRPRKAREAELAAREKEKADKAAEKERIRNEEFLRKQAILDKEKAEKKAAADAVDAQKHRIKACEIELYDFLKANNLMEDVDTNLIQTFFVRKPNITFVFAKVFTVEDAEEILATVTSEEVTALPDKSVPAVVAFNSFVTMREQLVGLTRYGERIKKVAPEEIAARMKAEKEKRAADRAARASA